MDNTTGCQLYLSKESLGTSITTAKSSEINVLVPGAEPDGDWVCFLVSFTLLVVRRQCSWFLILLFQNIILFTVDCAVIVSF